MKLPDMQKKFTSAPLNVFSLVTVSLVWGMMLGLISPWFSALAVLTSVIGYGSEAREK